MQNETSSDTSDLEAEVGDAVEQGRDVQERVLKLTLRIISARSLDIESVRKTANAVLRGARAGVLKELRLWWPSCANTGSHCRPTSHC